jgi:hypothetical protein
MSALGVKRTSRRHGVLSDVPQSGHYGDAKGMNALDAR